MNLRTNFHINDQFLKILMKSIDMYHVPAYLPLQFA